MAANILPSGIGDLFTLAERMDRGIERHGIWTLDDIKCATKDFTGLLKTARETERLFCLARAEKATATKRFIAVDDELTAWLAKARLVVMLALGSQWSECWVAAGFTHRGTNVPKRVAPRIELGRRLVEFFAEHVEYEVKFAGVTAEHARDLMKAIGAAEKKIATAKTSMDEKKRARDAAEKKLRRAMHDIISLLPFVIGKSDPRWLDFGLRQPCQPAPARHAAIEATAPEPVAVDFRPPAEQPPEAVNAAA